MLFCCFFTTTTPESCFQEDILQCDALQTLAPPSPGSASVTLCNPLAVALPRASISNLPPPRAVITAHLSCQARRLGILPFSE